MGTQGTGRKRSTKKERSTAEDDALNLIAREAEARLAAKRAARAEAREIRMRELERQQKEIFQVQKKYYGLDTRLDDRGDSKWGDIEQWMEDSERYSRSSRIHTHSDDDERMSVGSRGSARSSLYEDSVCSGSRRVAASTSHPLEYTSYRSSSSRASSRASSARTSPVDNCSSVASFLRSAASSSGLPRDLDDVTIPDFSDVEDRDYLEKGSRAASALTAGTLTSLGGTSSRRGSGETALTLDAETSIRELKEIHELKDQIQDVEIKYTQNLKEAKDALAEVEEKYRKAMVSNAQLDNEKNNLMYQVDTLKDSLMELEEMLSESQRGYEEKVKELEREKHAHSVLQFQFNEMKETLKQSEELLNEIRQLRMKQEGFVREISDLQETVEWKDKKIGALERQKEYTDAIRIERDELREEVVKLKDILKKHGIVLGPDLNINGDVGETEGDGSSSADAASQSAAGPQTPPTEGNSMLGNTEETQLTSRGEEEGDPEQHGEMFEEAKENHLSSDTICNYAGVSPLETQREEQPTEEQQTCLAKEEGDVAPSGLSTDLNVDINKCSLTEAKDAVICSSELQEIVTSSEENTGEKEKPEGGDSGEFSNPDLEETENKSSSVETQSDDNRESCNNKQEDVEESHLRKSDSCPQQKVAQEFSKESLPGESVPAASNTKPQQAPDNAEEAESNTKPQQAPDNAEEAESNTKPQQAPDNAEEAENDEDTEEMQSISQPQGATASGKKKKKKRRGKKKGGAQQKDEAIKEKGKTEKKGER
uniref:leucine-rich repeat flightless-interacting protein 1 isoform X3 n=1 Tax=Scatophagus argus TaxID=75038 RepID=UPI001ED83AFA|nr:leucine-rich repeat flightless-interacting protein 1 isoform X3 [Scatophagus argus]